VRHVGTIGLLLVLYVLPVVVLVLQAGAPGWRFPELIPDMSMEGLAHLASRPGPMLASLGSSVAYSLATVALTLVMTIIPSRILAFESFPGKHVLEGLLLLPALVPSMTFSMGLHFVFIKFGLADSAPGVVLVLAMVSYPYMLRALTAGYAQMGREFGECARNLGASRASVFRDVEMPLIFPAVAAGGSVVFLVAFSEYFLVFLIGGGTVPSFTGYLFPLITSSNRGMGALVTLVFLAMPITMFVVLEMLMSAYYRKRLMR
jgi:putative spermidine/putrescine transport system permease protein